jgi:virulence factor Mce-like protein
MSTRRRTDAAPSTTLIGAIILVAGLIGVVLAYNANRGLPFVPTYDITVEVPDAARLVEAASEVRIGGTRIGLVQHVEAVRAQDGRPPFARVRIALDPDQAGLPVDTRATVRPRSLLGAKYLAIFPGRSEREIPAGGTIPLEQAIPVVEVEDTFDIFGGESARALQEATIALGDGLAGRGGALNETFAELRRLLPPAQAVLRTLTAQRTDLGGFVEGAASTAAALEPVAGELASLVGGAATTFEALDRSGAALPDTVSELGLTERVGIRATATLRPVLADAAAIARELRPATRILPRVSEVAADAVRDATPGLRRLPGLRAPAERALAALDRLAADPATGRVLGDLTRAVAILESVLPVLGPAQVECNVLGLWARNTGSAVSQGDAMGNWLTFLFVFAEDAFQQAQPSPQLHFNPYPHEGAEECEGGNEPFQRGRRQLGSPPGRQSGVEETRPPAESRERARAAGLLERPEGAR